MNENNSIIAIKFQACEKRNKHLFEIFGLHENRSHTRTFTHLSITFL
jgi:hypothetical protein